MVEISGSALPFLNSKCSGPSNKLLQKHNTAKINNLMFIFIYIFYLLSDEPKIKRNRLNVQLQSIAGVTRAFGQLMNISCINFDIVSTYAFISFNWLNIIWFFFKCIEWLYLHHWFVIFEAFKSLQGCNWTGTLTRQCNFAYM